SKHKKSSGANTLFSLGAVITFHDSLITKEHIPAFYIGSLDDMAMSCAAPGLNRTPYSLLRGRKGHRKGMQEDMRLINLLERRMSS
ncbi:hypothetical protein PMZ84_24925, partial [[Clostridium] symbiosum]|uniref:hypothetical protein n=1 Tax=Clostridium symbiosum TaxID=1512 RepID=UPI001A9BA1C7